MRNVYMIACGDAYQRRIISPSPEWAIKTWLDEEGYDSIDQAARENYCLVSEITALLLSTLEE